MLIRVKVFPDASKNLVEAEKDRLRVFVKDSALNNQANRQVRILLSKHYQVPIDSVHIILGHRSTNKTVEIKNTD